MYNSTGIHYVSQHVQFMLCYIMKSIFSKFGFSIMGWMVAHTLNVYKPTPHDVNIASDFHSK